MWARPVGGVRLSGDHDPLSREAPAQGRALGRQGRWARPPSRVTRELPLRGAMAVVSENLVKARGRLALRLDVERGQPRDRRLDDRRHTGADGRDPMALAEAVAVRARARVAGRRSLGHERVAEAAVRDVRRDCRVVPPAGPEVRIEGVDRDVARPFVADGRRSRSRPVDGLAAVEEAAEDALLGAAVRPAAVDLKLRKRAAPVRDVELDGLLPLGPGKRSRASAGSAARPAAPSSCRRLPCSR